MSWGAVAGAAVGVVGSALSSSAAGDASAAQSQSAQQSNALQQYMYDNNVKLQAPAINTGNAARDRLSFLLGLSGTGFSNSGTTLGSSTSPNAPLTYDQLRQQLVGQFTSQGAPAGPTQYASQRDAINALGLVQGIGAYDQQVHPGASEPTPTTYGATSTPASTIDEQGLAAAINQRLQQQQDAANAAEAAARANPEFGSLAQPFQFNTFTPDTFSYTGQDLYTDPSYEFRLEQGQKALDRQGAAAGRFLSGAQLQASSNYNQGAASQEFQNAYQRALGTFNTNEGNKANAFSTNEGNRFNAYQANFNNAVNPLLALSGAATLGSQNLGSAGAAAANQMGQNLQGAANASGAAGIASANSINSALTSGVNNYNNNQLLSSLLSGKNGTGVNNNPYTASSVAAYGNNSLFGSGSGGMGD